MKKLLSVLLIFAVALCCAPRALSAAEGVYKVNSDAAFIYAEADGLSSVIGESVRGRLIDVVEISGGYGRAFFPSIGLYGWVEMRWLTAADPAETGTDVTAIRVTPPDKTEYVHTEEELNLAGMRVTAVHADGSETKARGYKVYADSFETTGEKTVTVSYTPAGSRAAFTDSFTVRVTDLPITGLEIVSQPTKTVYKEHELLSLDGLRLRVNYSDRPSEEFTGAEALANGDFKLSPDPAVPLEPGEQNLVITYKYPGVTAAVPVTVTPRVLTGLTVKSMPESLVVYSRDEAPSLKGLVLTASYDNGETEDVEYHKCREICDPSAFILGRGNKVRVEYGSLFVTLDFTLAQNTVKGLYVVTPRVVTFRMGFDVDLSGLKVSLEYMDGSTEPVTGYTLSPIDKTLAGTQNVVVEYGGYSSVFSIAMTPYYGRGDINGSGEVDVTDARLALRAAIGLIKVAGITLDACDINRDGKPDVGDARRILRHAIRLDDFIAESRVILP